MKRYLGDWRLLIPGLLIVAIVILALAAEFVAPYDPLAIDTANSLRPPSAAHWFGTDEYGRDILSRVIYGARSSLAVAVCSVILAALVGVSIGVISGYLGGWTEILVMRLADAILCFPPVILGIMIIGLLGPSFGNLVVVLGVLYIPHFARISHSSTLVVKSHEYVEAHYSIGATGLRVIRKTILPNILPPLIVQASLSVAAVILLESGMSFLGLGIVPPTPSWGLMIGDGRGYMAINPWYVFWPSMVLAATILAINSFGDGLRDVLDPRIRKG